MLCFHRGNALGICSASSRLGGIASTVVLMISNDVTFPNCIFGSMAIASGRSTTKYNLSISLMVALFYIMGV